MEGLPEGFFQTTATFACMDGLFAARMSAVCRAWRHQVKRVASMACLMDMHHVRVESNAELNRAWGRNKIQQVSQLAAAKQVSTLLFAKHDFNGYAIPEFNRILCIYPGLLAKPVPDFLFHDCGIKFDDGCYHQDVVNGDIILSIWNCECVDRVCERLKWFSTIVFPGKTIIWKFIERSVGSLSLLIRFCTIPAVASISTTILRKLAKSTKKRPRKMSRSEELVQKKIKEK